MTDQVSSLESSRPVRNLRITFWGVQGSCSIFPTRFSIKEFSRRLAVHTLSKAFQELQKLSDSSADQRCRVEDILHGPVTEENIERFQRQLGIPDLSLYGGETTCIEIETAEGDIIILDAGSGIRRCSLDIIARRPSRPGRALHLFGSHEHLDHRSGLTFARFCYVEPDPFNIHVYGSHQFLSAIDHHYGVFSRDVSRVSRVDDPVDFTMMPAVFTGTELYSGQNAALAPGRWSRHDIARPIRIGKTTITAFEVYHVIPSCLAYKVEHNGASFVFCTDHELRRGAEPSDPRQVRSLAAEASLRRMLQDVDVAYLDGQYLLEEYLGKKGVGALPPFPRVDWGHSCIEDVIDRAVSCNVKHTYVGHHDPERTWSERIELDQHLARICEGKPNRIRLADSDAVVDL